jgi:hypothetical protein
MDKKPNQKRKKVNLPTSTPEQIAANKAAAEKAEAEAKAERERVELYAKSAEKMSHRQLSAELKKTVRREHVKEGGKRVPVAGLTIAFATILSAMLDNTSTSPVTEDGRRLRKDQLNPAATRTMNPGW